MKIKTGLILVIAAFFILINAKTTFSQEPTVQGGAIPETQNEPETQWVWGEVVTLDMQNKVFLVKYLDYETDQEKEISINVDDKTNYENIKSIDEIKPKDAVSIDYIVSADGKNIAKNISIERPEEEQSPKEENVTEEQKVTPPITEETSETVPTN